MLKKIPVGTEAQKPTGEDGLIRYNDETNEFEGYGNGAWGSLGGVKTSTGNTKITARDTNGLEFYTGESSANERMTILANGNVGIGHTDPESALDVKGQIVIRKSSNQVRAADGANIEDYYLQIGDGEYGSPSSFPNGLKRLIGFGFRNSNTVDAYIGSATVGAGVGDNSDIIFGTANDTGSTTDPTEKNANYI